MSNEQDERAATAIRTWLKQTVLLAMNVRAMDLGKPTPSEHSPELLAYADEIWQRLATKHADPQPSDGMWLVRLADETFRWVQEHLDR